MWSRNFQFVFGTNKRTYVPIENKVEFSTDFRNHIISGISISQNGSLIKKKIV